MTRLVRWVRVDAYDPEPSLAAYLADGWVWDRRVHFPASARVELATAILWKWE